MRKILNLVVFSILLQLSAPTVFAQSAEDCRKQGKVRDPKTGRCVLSQDTVDAKVNASKCEGLSGQAYNDCFKKNAQESAKNTGLKEADDVKDGQFGRYSMSAIAGVLSAYFLLKNKGSYDNCSATSAWMILGGAGSAAITELLAQKRYSDKTKDLAKNYESKVNASKSGAGDEKDKSTEAQTYALELMIEQEKARKDAASTRKKGYSLSTAMYAGAAIVATYESIQHGMTGKDCTADASSEEPTEETDPQDVEVEDVEVEDVETEMEPTEPQKNSLINLEPLWMDEDLKREFADFSHLKEVTHLEFMEMIARKIWSNVVISEASADGTGLAVKAKSAWGGIKTGLVKFGDGLGWLGTKIRQGMSHPVARAGFAGVMGIWAYDTVDKAKDNEDIADKRIKAIEKILAEFKESGGSKFQACSAKDRDDKSNPGCYCYKNDGKPDPRRVNRPVCVAYSSGDPLVAGQYGGLGTPGYAPVRDCFKDGGEIDEDCKVCKRFPERCPAIAQARMGSLAFGGGLGITGLVEDNNALVTGRAGIGEMDVTENIRRALRIRKAKDQLSKKNKKFGEAAKKAEKITERFRTGVPAMLRKTFRSNPSALASVGNAKTGSEFKIPKELDKNEKIKEVLSSIEKNTKRSGAYSPPKSEDGFDFDFGESAGGVVIEEIEEVMDKDFAFKGDINKNPGHNIFKILSLRYQRSGLRRLFDAEGKSEADAAEEETINAR